MRSRAARAEDVAVGNRMYEHSRLFIFFYDIHPGDFGSVRRFATQRKMAFDGKKDQQRVMCERITLYLAYGGTGDLGFKPT